MPKTSWLSQVVEFQDSVVQVAEKLSKETSNLTSVCLDLRQGGWSVFGFLQNSLRHPLLALGGMRADRSYHAATNGCRLEAVSVSAV